VVILSRERSYIDESFINKIVTVTKVQGDILHINSSEFTNPNTNNRWGTGFVYQEEVVPATKLSQVLK